MHLKGSPKGDAKVQEHLEDPAKVLFLLHQVLRLGISAVGRIMKNFPEKRNKYLSISRHKVDKTSLFLFVESRGGETLAIRQLGKIFWGLNYAQDIDSGLVN